MDREQILDVFRSLACSQGFYGRLLRDISENEEWGDEFLNHLEEQNFRTELDLILYIES
jgi:hypothetical protein